MQLKPVHKLSLLALVGSLLAALLVWAGFAWGHSAGRADERMLTAKQARAAQQRMAAAGDEADDEPAAGEEPTRLTKARYIAWLEQRVDALDEQAQHAAAEKTSQAAAAPSYVEFARLVLTAAQPAAASEGPQRLVASKVAAQVLNEFWQEAHGETLGLPDDLFARTAQPLAVASRPSTATRPPQAPAKVAPPRETVLGTSSQASAIRSAIAEFNAR